MNAKEFEEWFKDHLSLMAEQGVMHYNSPWGRSVKLALSVTQPEIDALRVRIEKLEGEVKSLSPSKVKHKEKND